MGASQAKSAFERISSGGHAHSGVGGKRDLIAAIEDNDVELLQQVVANNPSLLREVLQHANNSAQLAVTTRAHAVLERIVAYAALASPSNKLESALRHEALKALNHRRASDGATALMLACELGDELSTKLLIKGGADPWRHDHHYRRTALHFAALQGQPGTIKLVVEHSYSVAPKEKRGLLAKMVSPEVMDQPKLLVDRGTRAGHTPLMYATWYDHAEAIAELGQLGASLNRRAWGWHDPVITYCNDGSSALHIAAIRNAARAARAILSEYAASLTPERIQQTARLAQRPSSFVDPRLLIDLDGRTPFSIARRMRNVALMRLLNPLTPIEHVFDDDSPEARIRGVPRLLQLAAQVAHKVLLGQIESLAKQIEARKASKAQKANTVSRLSPNPVLTSPSMVGIPEAPHEDPPSDSASFQSATTGNLSSNDGSRLGSAATPLPSHTIASHSGVSVASAPSALGGVRGEGAAAVLVLPAGSTSAATGTSGSTGGARGGARGGASWGFQGASAPSAPALSARTSTPVPISAFAAPGAAAAVTAAMAGGGFEAPLDAAPAPQVLRAGGLRADAHAAGAPAARTSGSGVRVDGPPPARSSGSGLRVDTPPELLGGGLLSCENLSIASASSNMLLMGLCPSLRGSMRGGLRTSMSLRRVVERDSQEGQGMDILAALNYEPLMLGQDALPVPPQQQQQAQQQQQQQQQQQVQQAQQAGRAHLPPPGTLQPRRRPPPPPTVAQRQQQQSQHPSQHQLQQEGEIADLLGLEEPSPAHAPQSGFSGRGFMGGSVRGVSGSGSGNPATSMAAVRAVEEPEQDVEAVESALEAYRHHRLLTGINADPFPVVSPEPFIVATVESPIAAMDSMTGPSRAQKSVRITGMEAASARRGVIPLAAWGSFEGLAGVSGASAPGSMALGLSGRYPGASLGVGGSVGGGVGGSVEELGRSTPSANGPMHGGVPPWGQALMSAPSGRMDPLAVMELLLNPTPELGGEGSDLPGSTDGDDEGEEEAEGGAHPYGTGADVGAGVGSVGEAGGQLQEHPSEPGRDEPRGGAEAAVTAPTAVTAHVAVTASSAATAVTQAAQQPAGVSGRVSGQQQQQLQEQQQQQQLQQQQQQERQQQHLHEEAASFFAAFSAQSGRKSLDSPPPGLARAGSLVRAGSVRRVPSVAHAAVAMQLSRALSIGATSIGDGEECGVCLDAGDFIYTRPCSHKICVNCATELVNLHPCHVTPCPFCRGMVRGFALTAAAKR